MTACMTTTTVGGFSCHRLRHYFVSEVLLKMRTVVKCLTVEQIIIFTSSTMPRGTKKKAKANKRISSVKSRRPVKPKPNKTTTNVASTVPEPIQRTNSEDDSIHSDDTMRIYATDEAATVPEPSIQRTNSVDSEESSSFCS